MLFSADALSRAPFQEGFDDEDVLSDSDVTFTSYIGSDLHDIQPLRTKDIEKPQQDVPKCNLIMSLKGGLINATPLYRHSIIQI